MQTEGHLQLRGQVVVLSRGSLPSARRSQRCDISFGEKKRFYCEVKQETGLESVSPVEGLCGIEGLGKDRLVGGSAGVAASVGGSSWTMDRAGDRVPVKSQLFGPGCVDVKLGFWALLKSEVPSVRALAAGQLVLLSLTDK